MATVRLNAELRAHINNMVVAPFAKRIDELHNSARKQIDEMAPQLYDDLIAYICEQAGTTREVYDQVPDSWLNSTESVSIYSINGNHMGSMRSVSFSKRLKVPSSFSTYNARLSGPQFNKYLEPGKRIERQVAEVVADRDRVKQAVDRILDQCTTLKQALEVYPALERWVPSQALEKMREPSSRKERVRAVRQSVDVSAITTALLRDRIETS